MTEGSYLHCENKSICVMVGGTEKTRIPAHTIEAIICLCNTSVSTPFIGFCGDNGISLSFHSDNGRFYGRVYGHVSGNVLLRKKQYQLIDSGESVEIVRNMILGKIINSRNVLMRASRNTLEEKVVTLKAQAEKLLEHEKLLASAQNIDSIRGVEGAAASIYFRAFASIVKGRHKAADVVAWLVPGSWAVDKQIREEGLDKVIEAAGFEIRQPGCSACLAMNDDKIPAGKYSVSTSNRNFEGRQGPGSRTILASPLVAAAAAVTGVITDPRTLM